MTTERLYSESGFKGVEFCLTRTRRNRAIDDTKGVFQKAQCPKAGDKIDMRNI